MSMFITFANWLRNVCELTSTRLRTDRRRLRNDRWRNDSLAKRPVSRQRVAWENRHHFTTLALDSLQNHIWGTAEEIPYCWHVTPQIWVVFLIGCCTRFASSKSTQIWVVGCALRFVSNKSEALPRSAVIPQMSFHGETNGGAKKWLLFSQARKSREDDLQCRSDDLGWLNTWY